ncbi:SAM-dependent methyltransferase [Nonlabens sp. MIC269]|uniref:tRNA (5-methylaminomethyl-2-thiouridine)(34)-methyltransferase MnmD n=1 Tax=Nonlabens sp. MIC269 TaxID=1476901 RepID=UPI0007206DA4|nr:tRNA (5-methylaminomethyl-2-thiouridine)(34)-methyltransferase MnmD [Nonlabens sp. MIC269]ALM20041.1 SAM-dependent methyltransferase [Nonlabens sp. MIC269]
MKREIMITGDGSKTIHMPDLNEQYHSKHGALQEALHVFIKMGLQPLQESLQPDNASLNILEYGFGTGLNAILTKQHASTTRIHYTAMEAYPVSADEVLAMDYGSLLKDQIFYEALHEMDWEIDKQLTSTFSIIKKQMKFEEVKFDNQFDLIYFDAFGPRTQPELWTIPIFQKAFDSLKNGGVLTTYCAQGQARRNMQEVGFKVERLPGPPGKREMLRATKL